MLQNEYIDINDFDPDYNGFYKHIVKGVDAPSSGYDKWLVSMFDNSGTGMIIWQNQPPTYF